MPIKVTTSPTETQQLATELASTFRGGEILALSGDLGAGKTTFTQGLLKALQVTGPYTSPTFAIIKNYQLTTKPTRESSLSVDSHELSVIYHIDAYRIDAASLAELGFADFAGQPKTLTIIEWPENVRSLLPPETIWLNFLWLSENRRQIMIEKK